MHQLWRAPDSMAARTTRPERGRPPDDKIQRGSCKRTTKSNASRETITNALIKRVRQGMALNHLYNSRPPVQDQPHLFAAEIFEDVSSGILPGHSNSSR